MYVNYVDYLHDVENGLDSINPCSSLRASTTNFDIVGVFAQGIRTIAEALERSERVRHVYVHAGGKVSAR